MQIISEHAPVEQIRQCRVTQLHRHEPSRIPCSLYTVGSDDREASLRPRAVEASQRPCDALPSSRV